MALVNKKDQTPLQDQLDAKKQARREEYDKLKASLSPRQQRLLDEAQRRSNANKTPAQIGIYTTPEGEVMYWDEAIGEWVSQGRKSNLDAIREMAQNDKDMAQGVSIEDEHIPNSQYTRFGQAVLDSMSKEQLEAEGWVYDHVWRQYVRKDGTASEDNVRDVTPDTLPQGLTTRNDATNLENVGYEITEDGIVESTQELITTHPDTHVIQKRLNSLNKLVKTRKASENDELWLLVDAETEKTIAIFSDEVEAWTASEEMFYTYQYETDVVPMNLDVNIFLQDGTKVRDRKRVGLGSDKKPNTGMGGWDDAPF